MGRARRHVSVALLAVLLCACEGGQIGPRPGGDDGDDMAGDVASGDSNPGDETVTAPGAPSAPGAAFTQIVHETQFSAATSSAGHSLEYRVDWGNGQISTWAASTSATMTWTAAGTYQVRAQARCAQHPQVTSDWSTASDWVVAASAAAPRDLFPPPQEQAFGSGVLTAPTATHWALVVGASPQPLVSKAAEWLTEKLATLGITCDTVANEPGGSVPTVVLEVAGSMGALAAEVSTLGLAPTTEMQGYVLGVTGGPRVVISGADATGVLYGCTSLYQMVEKTDATHVGLDRALVRDWPDIKYRVWGNLEGFSKWLLDASTTDKFKIQFERYLRDWLIPRRINIIPMVYGGFNYHERHYASPFSRYSDIPEVKGRLATGVQMAGAWGVELQYHDRTGVGWDEDLSTTPPYDELIWHQDYFTCYSRDALITAAANEMGQFMEDVGLRRIYIHQFDGTTGGWDSRCSQCKTTYPHDAADDPEKTEMALAQAHLGNLYYDTLKTHVPDLLMVMVESLYDDTGTTYPEYHGVLDELLRPEIIPLIRETGRETVEIMRSYYPERPFYTYVESDESIDWEPLFDLVARYTKDFYFGDDRDLVFASPQANGNRVLAFDTHAYYAWNMDALGSESMPTDNRHIVLNPLRDSVGLSTDALSALEKILRFEYNQTWATQYPRVALTWISRGLVVTPARLAPGRWQWDRINYWFSQQLSSFSSNDAKWLELHRLHMVEAERIEPEVDAVFQRTDVPDEMWRTYAYAKGTCLLAEPRYWELKCKQQGGSPAPADVAAGLAAVAASRAQLPAVEAKIAAGTYHATQGWTTMDVVDILDGIEVYLEAL